MESPEDFLSLQSAARASLVSATRTASQLAAQDLTFHRSLDSSFASSLDRQNARLLGLSERLLAVAAANSEIVRPPRLSDIDAVDGNWRAVVDVVDSLLERTDTALDEFTGAVKRLSPGAPGPNDSSSKSIRPSRIANALKSQDLPKPQLTFDNLPDNYATGSFKPLLTTKPHASVPLEVNVEEYAHPYQKEIENYEYPTAIYDHVEPIPYHPFDTTTATLVDTEEAMFTMLDELKQAKEIAVDLEHHDRRSYIGIVSLMQISTRDKDWIVDTLKPWRRKLECLNEVFADPNIIKVLHGAFMDVVWLQRDLGLYLVGLFDTHYASRALGYTGGSLAFLLKKFVDVDAQKQYQLADWRVRPLPQELFDYARSDTHYLLYIFDCMRNELIERSDFSLPDHEGDKIWDVLQKSNETALKKYDHPIYDAKLGQSAGWYRMLARTSTNMTKEQFAVFRAVHRWRDDVAREQDDNLQYVMPNHQIFSIAKLIPVDKTALLGVVQPLTQTVRLRIDDLVAVIVQAKDSASNGPEMMDLLNEVEPQPSHRISQVVPTLQIHSPMTQAPINKPTSTTSLRTSISSFWKGLFGGGSSQHRSSSTASPNVSLRIPLPPLGADIFATPADIAATDHNDVNDTPIPKAQAVIEPPKADDVFTLKGQSRKRSHNHISTDGMANQADEIDIAQDYEAEREALLKKERKKLRREAKQAQKAARQATAGAGAEDDTPFDYNAAPSILDPPSETREEMKERRKKEKNPYAKAMDAPKGLPRVQKERAGRTMTYR